MDFVQVRSYDNYVTANLTLQRLEAEGIRGYLKDEYTVTIDPILSNAVGGIKLMVLDSQVARSLDLLEEFETAYREAAACPHCGSTNVHFISQPNNPGNWLSAMLTWIFGSYAVSVRNVYHCFDCGHDFDSIP